MRLKTFKYLKDLYMNSIKLAFLWNGIGKVAQFLITFISSVLIARILSPSDYGLVGVLAVFTAISSLLIDSGFRDVLILNTEKNTSLEYSTIFYVNLSMSIVLYILLYFIAPYIGSYFENELLTILSRVVFISLLINGFSIIPLTILSINLNFKIISIIDFLGIIISSFIGLLMAYNNFGIWSLVYPMLISSLFRLVGFWIFSKWIPAFIFDFTFIKSKIRFCSKLIILRLLDAVSSNFIPIIIGKLYSLRDVGFFNRANNLQTMPNNIIVATVNEVSYPMLSMLENKARIEKFKELIKLSSMITFPIAVGIMITANSLIIVLLTDKWSASIPMLQILSLLIAISLLSFINNSMIKIGGNINALFWISLVKNVSTVLLLVGFRDYGIMTLCFVFVGISFISHFFYMYFSSKVTLYSLSNQIKDLLPSFYSATSMGLIMYLVAFLIKDSKLVLLLVQVTIGFGYLIGIYWLFFKKERKMILALISK